MALLVTAGASARIGGELRELKKKLPSSDRLFEKLTKDKPAISSSLEEVVTEEGDGDPDPCSGYRCWNIPPWNGYPGCGGS